MKRDHMLKEELKKDKEKLMNKIKAIKDEEEKEKEMLDEHYKTKMTKKIVERADEDEELVLDEDEEKKMTGMGPDQILRKGSENLTVEIKVGVLKVKMWTMKRRPNAAVAENEKLKKKDK